MATAFAQFLVAVGEESIWERLGIFCMTHDFDVVAIGADDERTVVV
jgi:hypothetical protein